MLRIIFFLLLTTCCYGKYYGQFGQDQYANEHFFKDLRNGVFVDIGAHDGITLNNTYFFEKERDWTGICIEPIPEIYEKLQSNRGCRTVNGCIYPEHNVLRDFWVIHGYSEMLSGLCEKYDLKHINRIISEIYARGGRIEIIKMRCYNINKLLEESNIKHIDFLSVDTEGGELDILKSIDYSKVGIDVITVENNYHDPAFRTFLESKGFVFVEKVDVDLIFVSASMYAKTFGAKT